MRVESCVAGSDNRQAPHVTRGRYLYVYMFILCMHVYRPHSSQIPRSKATEMPFGIQIAVENVTKLDE